MNSKVISALVCTAILFAVGCRPNASPDKAVAGAVLGAGWGAGAGAVVGNQTSNTGPGAAIGAGFGAVGGLIHGMSLDSAEIMELERQREIDALRVQVASNQRALYAIRDDLDNRAQELNRNSSGTQIFFDENKASLRAGSAAQLQRLAESIKMDPYVGSIEVHGHSDDTGETEKNLRLSEARARTVASFLAAQGISLDRIMTVSHGAKEPLASNENESGRQLNRRVEVVLKK